MDSQVTTKTGDSGEASTLGGDRVSKTHPVMECVGTLDELRAHLARLRLRMLEIDPERHADSADFLLWLLHVGFLLGSACSDYAGKHPEYRRRDLGEEDLARLETEQARLESRTPLPHSFIVSASTPLAADADVACTIARRFERALVRLKELEPAFNAQLPLRFVNRLSDYLFILARDLEHPDHHAVDYSLLDN